ncbi:MAG TPA: multicopper oxidase family protein [Asanoa sp.]
MTEPHDRRRGETGPPAQHGRRRLIGLVAAITATVAILGTLGYFWFASLVPSTYSVMDLGYAEGGGDPTTGHAHGGLSIATLTGPDSRPDVAVTLIAREESYALASGERVTGYTVNHTSPGPLVRATVGQLVEVTLVNDDVSDGVSLHWHGVDVPNAEDGVAGVTQDAVAPGGSHVYRFRAEQPGTYWYHSHQASEEQVMGGLYGALVVDPRQPAAGQNDVVVPVHTYAGRRAAAGRTGTQRIVATPGDQVRLRLIDTDSAPLRATVTGTPYRVVAVDGRDLNGPTDVTDPAVVVAAGGRVDLGVTVPTDGKAVRLDLGAGSAVLVGPPSAADPGPRESAATLDLLSYGTPRPTELVTAAQHPDRTFELSVGRRPAFVDGRPGLFWTMNGHTFPDVPMFMVRYGDVVVMTVKSSSSQPHPMHLHGHHALVLSRDGVAASGSPWWTDSLEVENGQSYVVAFRADNPGIWLDHCHNLKHAADGMIAHVAYEGYTTPYRVGGSAGNDPE